MGGCTPLSRSRRAAVFAPWNLPSLCTCVCGLGCGLGPVFMMASSGPACRQRANPTYAANKPSSRSISFFFVLVCVARACRCHDVRQQQVHARARTRANMPTTGPAKTEAQERDTHSATSGLTVPTVARATARPSRKERHARDLLPQVRFIRLLICLAPLVVHVHVQGKQAGAIPYCIPSKNPLSEQRRPARSILLFLLACAGACVSVS